MKTNMPTKVYQLMVQNHNNGDLETFIFANENDALKEGAIRISHMLKETLPNFMFASKSAVVKLQSTRRKLFNEFSDKVLQLLAREQIHDALIAFNDCEEQDRFEVTVQDKMLFW